MVISDFFRQSVLLEYLCSALLQIFLLFIKQKKSGLLLSRVTNHFFLISQNCRPQRKSISSALSHGMKFWPTKEK